VREHSDSLHKPKAYLTFDLDRDYFDSGSYARTPSFEGVRHNVPRILDKMHKCHVDGTFFLTPEIMENCVDTLRDIRQRQPSDFTHTHTITSILEFKRWERDGDSFRNYTDREKIQIILRDIQLCHAYLGAPKLFRISRLEPDNEILRIVIESGCQYDSSYPAVKCDIFEKIWTALSYKFKEILVDFHLYSLEISQLERRSRSVVSPHPITPPERTNPVVYDEGRLLEMIEGCSEQFRFGSIDEI